MQVHQAVALLLGCASILAATLASVSMRQWLQGQELRSLGQRALNEPAAAQHQEPQQKQEQQVQLTAKLAWSSGPNSESRLSRANTAELSIVTESSVSSLLYQGCKISTSKTSASELLGEFTAPLSGYWDEEVVEEEEEEEGELEEAAAAAAADYAMNANSHRAAVSASSAENSEGEMESVGSGSNDMLLDCGDDPELAAVTQVCVCVCVTVCVCAALGAGGVVVITCL